MYPRTLGRASLRNLLWVGDRTLLWLYTLLLKELKQQPGLLINQLLNPLDTRWVPLGRLTEVACFAVLASR